MQRCIPLLLSAVFAVPAVAAAQQPAEKTIPSKVRLFIPYKDYSPEDNKRVLDMYKYLRVADVSDGMDVVGLQNVGLVNQEIHALWKDTDNFTHRVVGVAVTARYVPTNKREPKMDDKTIGQWYTTEIIHQKVPVYFRRLARGIRPGRNELESVNRPVTVGGVLVRPGDVVMADGDGVVVVPREHAEEVANAALPFLDNIGRERYIKETGKNPWKK